MSYDRPDGRVVVREVHMRSCGIAVTFNYRGSWGSPGTFSFEGNLEDTEAVLSYLRYPKNTASLRLDPHRIVLGDHSMGGAITAAIAARDHDLQQDACSDQSRLVEYANRIGGGRD